MEDIRINAHHTITCLRELSYEYSALMAQSTDHNVTLIESDPAALDLVAKDDEQPLDGRIAEY